MPIIRGINKIFLKKFRFINTTKYLHLDYKINNTQFFLIRKEEICF